MEIFSMGDDLVHHKGDGQCPGCAAQFPEPCRCGGLMHGAVGEEEDTDGNWALSTRCDRCGRSDEDLAEAV